jgi:hypothetical protein
MSWIDQVSTNFIITTGDGKQYTPLWVLSSKEVTYNISEFEFPKVSGTLVKRGTPKGRKFAIEIYFQGENYLEQALAFENSANDSRPWIISHPLHGSITAQPIALSYDYTKYNSCKISGSVTETITEERPKGSPDPVAKIFDDKEDLDNVAVEAFTVTASAADITSITNNSLKTYNLFSKIINSATEAEEYFNLYKDLNTKILNLITLPTVALQALQAFYNYPALLSADVQVRVNAFSDQLNLLKAEKDGITGLSEKKSYETQGSATISAAALASANPLPGNYGNRASVLAMIQLLIDMYNSFLQDPDDLQSDNGGDPDSYIPDAAVLIGLNDLINYTVSSLFNIALGAKQERSVYIEDDSNVVILAHRFYGLKADDSSIDELIKNNNIGLSEILQIKKGRKIVYYV